MSLRQAFEQGQAISAACRNQGDHQAGKLGVGEYEQKGEACAEYGAQLVERLGKDLVRQFGRGFSEPNLWRMRAFYLAWAGDRFSRHRR